MANPKSVAAGLNAVLGDMTNGMIEGIQAAARKPLATIAKGIETDSLAGRFNRPGFI